MPVLESLYQKLMKENEGRVCLDISDQACEVVPHNFFAILFSNILTKIADTLADAKTVLPCLIVFLGAPVYFLALLVPIRESGALIPQIFIASIVQRFGRRKWMWIFGSILQALAIFSMALSTYFLEDIMAGIALISALCIFSFARGICSVVSKDVVGKVIPKTRRGRLSGFSGCVAGIVTIVAGLNLILGDDVDESQYALLLLISSVLWFFSAFSYVTIKEDKTKPNTQGYMASLGLLKSDSVFRRFVLVRALMLSSALSAPFYVVMSQSVMDNRFATVGMFVLAAGAAGFISSPIWGKWVDISSSKVMILTGILTGVLGVLVVLIDSVFHPMNSWIYPLAFFLLSIIHQGVRLARQTYVVDMADGNTRTHYVVISNTIIGLILLFTGLLSSLVAVVSLKGVVVLLAFSALWAAFLARKLPEVESL